jgi:hypothetical protein
MELTKEYFDEVVSRLATKEDLQDIRDEILLRISDAMASIEEFRRRLVRWFANLWISAVIVGSHLSLTFPLQLKQIRLERPRSGFHLCGNFLLITPQSDQRIGVPHVRLRRFGVLRFCAEQCGRSASKRLEI